jgi:TonB-dependent receptor
MSLGITDSQVIRFSYSESMARPSLQDLKSQLSYGNKNFIQGTASGGNPDLEPLMSKNFDISYENYYAEGSYLAINYFKKDIEDFIGTKTVFGTVDGLTDPSKGTIGAFAVACVNEWVAAGRPQTGFPGDAGATGHCVSQQALWAQGWMNDFHHMGWVAVAMANGTDVSAGFPWGQCQYDGWWRCDPGYIDGQPGDPLANFEITRPYNKEKGSVDGFEIVLQHLFQGTPYGLLFNATKISGGDVDVDRNLVGEQFILPGLGDSGNFSIFYEDDKHTARLALNYRGETVAGFGNYTQPLYVEERTQIDASYQYRLNENTTLFIDAMNINDESTRLHARYEEMLFLSQDHGPVYKIGFRTNF